MLAAAIALLSAFLFAVGSAAQQKMAASVPTGEARGVRLILILVRRPMWVLGVGGDAAGYVCQAGALALGSLLLVQPLLVTSLLFALPISAKINKRKLQMVDGVWAIVLTAALGLFVVAGNPSEGNDLAPFSDWAVPTVALVVLVVACVVVSRLHAPLAAALLGTASGALFGIGAALTKSAMNLLGQGIPTLVTSWELYALIISAIFGAILQEDAFQAGDLQASFPAMTILEPIVAAIFGVAVLHEAIRADGIEWALIAAAVVAMGLATVTLARRAAALEDDPPSSATPGR